MADEETRVGLLPGMCVTPGIPRPPVVVAPSIEGTFSTSHSRATHVSAPHLVPFIVNDYPERSSPAGGS